MENRTHYIIDLADVYNNMSEVEKVVARKCITCFAQSEERFTITDTLVYNETSFRIFPTTIVDAMETVNNHVGYKFRYRLRVDDLGEWQLHAYMTETTCHEMHNEYFG